MRQPNETRRAGGSTGFLEVSCEEADGQRNNTRRRDLQAPLAAGADLRETVARYAAIDRPLVATYGASNFLQTLISIGGAP